MRMNKQDRITKKKKSARQAASAMAKLYADVEPETNVIDILTDLHHYCDVNHLSFEEMLGRADYHYTAETTGKEP